MLSGSATASRGPSTVRCKGCRSVAFYLKERISMSVWCAKSLESDRASIVASGEPILGQKEFGVREGGKEVLCVIYTTRQEWL